MQAMATRNLAQLEAQAVARIDSAIGEYKPFAMYSLLSGGTDSMTATTLAAQHPAFSGVVHINTGIGIRQTSEFVRQTCKEQGWPLHELQTGKYYLQHVVRYGFPGAAQHTIMYRMLKERALMAFLKEKKKGRKRTDCIALVTGARSDESTRRMGNMGETVRKQGGLIWINAIEDWLATDTTAYMMRAGIPTNPVKRRMHISGECLCGCFPRVTERIDLEDWFPDTAKEIAAYEQVVQLVCELGLNDIPLERRRWGWDKVAPAEQSHFLPLCQFCHASREEAA